MTEKELKIFRSIPTIKTERLILREISAKDLDDIYEYSIDPKVSEFLFWSPHRDKRFTEKYLSSVITSYKRGRYYNWGIEYEGKMIGTCGFTSFDIKHNTGEIGYVLNSSFWGKGIATEAARAVIEYGFYSLNLEKIEIRYMVENTASAVVAQKCGMKKCEFPYYLIKCKGENKVVGVCSVTRDEYDKSGLSN